MSPCSISRAQAVRVLTMPGAVAGRAAMGTEEQREATTGQVVLRLPQVWAVGEPSAEAWVGDPTESNAEQPAMPAATPPGVELAFYRKYTEAMLRRYTRLSMEAGRAPSLLGREMFRGRVTSYRVHSFDDVVIFCHDVEKLLQRLPPLEQQLVKRIALQEYTQGEVAAMLGLSLRSCIKRYVGAVDRLTACFLEAGLMEPQGWCQ